MHPNENVVDVNYEILLEDGKTAVSVLNETHTMRYLFKPEIESFMENRGFRLVRCEEWLSGNQSGFNTWGVTFLGLKK